MTGGDENTVQACPGCGSASIRPRSQKYTEPEGSPGEWWCSVCNSHFDEPVDREPIFNVDRTPTRGLASTLAKMGEERDEAGVTR